MSHWRQCVCPWLAGLCVGTGLLTVACGIAALFLLCMSLLDTAKLADVVLTHLHTTALKLLVMVTACRVTSPLVLKSTT